MTASRVGITVLLALVTLGWRIGTAAPSSSGAESTDVSAPLDLPVDPPTRFPAPERIVAFGDWHGDLDAARSALRLAGAIDDHDHWIGAELVVVQTGDQIDRGDEEQAILDLLDRLQDEARASGGAVHALLGNHEIMNVEGDFRYVTDGGWADFADAGVVVEEADSLVASLPEEHRPRATAFRPGGQYARMLAERNVAVIVGRTLFVHGGILPGHLEYGLERLNEETRAWLRGTGPMPTVYEMKDDPVWARQYSDEPDDADCALLYEVLTRLDCDRMVVGHTVQEDGITPQCGDRVWCIDTGAAEYYGGKVQGLEITASGVRLLSVD
ncbi:MAG: metallophosphoesterase [Candidatus Eisenbacteria bacterium]